MSRTRRRQKNGGKVFATILAVVLSLVAGGCAGAWGAGFALTGEANPAKWSSLKSTTTKPLYRTVAITNDGQEMINGEAYDMPATGFAFLSVRNLSSETAEYVADGEITLTAELSNQYINGKFDYTVDFKDPEAQWAQGKVASYYIGLEPIDGGRQVKVNYLAPFSEQIILTATLQGTESSDSCTIDCVRAATFNKLSYAGEFDITDRPCASADVVFGEGTITGDFSNGAVSFGIEEDFIEKVNDYLNFTISVNRYGYAAEPEFYIDSAFWLNGENPLTYSDIIEGYDDYDQDHKDAICFAWFRGYEEYAKTSNAASVLFDVSVNYYYAGVLIETIKDSDILCDHHITGESAAYGITPSVTLNKNVVF